MFLNTGFLKGWTADKLRAAGDLVACSTEQAAQLSAWKGDVMKHKNYTFPKQRDFWVSDLVFLLIGYILILNVHCMLLHIFTESGTANICGLQKADFYRGHVCKAKKKNPSFNPTICCDVTKSILSHSPSAPHFIKVPLTSQRCLMSCLKPHFPRFDFVVLHGDPWRSPPRHPAQALPALLTSHLPGGELTAQQQELEQSQPPRFQMPHFYLKSLQLEAPFP